MFLKVLFQGNPRAHGLPSPLLHSHECSPEYGAVVVSDAHQRRYRRCVMLSGRSYDQALSAFNARWPVVAQSPGGMPPQVTTSQARNAPVPTPEQRHIVRASESVPQAPALQAANPTPIPGLVNVTLTSNPPGALVSFSRMAVCYTPCVTKLQPQRYKVAMKLAGHAEWTAEITVEAGKPSTVAAELQRQTEQP
jgi:hypothetical protein